MTKNITDRVQSKVNKGYGKAAQILGQPCDVFRASGPNNPLTTTGNNISALYVLFSQDAGIKLAKPRQYKDAQMFASVDRTDLEIGDYFVNTVTNEVYFINTMESLTPTGVERCNAYVSFYRPTAEDDTGTGYVSNGYTDTKRNIYGGNPDNKGLPLAMNWPCSMLLGTKGERAQLNIPDQTRIPWYAIKLPNIPTVQLETNDIAVYGDRTFFISGLEASEMGLNITLDETTI